eukprot:Nk52_evm19s279 gene=Nk52_evmTU19s279
MESLPYLMSQLLSKTHAQQKNVLRPVNFPSAVFICPGAILDAAIGPLTEGNCMTPVSGWDIIQSDVLRMHKVLSNQCPDFEEPPVSLEAFDFRPVVADLLRSYRIVDGSFLCALLNSRIPDDCVVCPFGVTSALGQWYRLKHFEGKDDATILDEFLAMKYAFSEYAQFFRERSSGIRKVYFPISMQGHNCSLLVDLEEQRWTFFGPLYRPGNRDASKTKNRRLITQICELFGSNNKGILSEIAVDEREKESFKLPFPNFPD